MSYDKTQQLIMAHEGLRLRPYQDSEGVWTIGYGRNIEKSFTAAEIGSLFGWKDWRRQLFGLQGGITTEEAEYLFLHDYNDIIDSFERQIPWFRFLGPVRSAVLLDMAFNLGMAGLLKFKLTLGHIADLKFDLAADEMLRSRWASQVGQRAMTLAQMMRSGEWPETSIQPT